MLGKSATVYVALYAMTCIFSSVYIRRMHIYFLEGFCEKVNKFEKTIRQK